MSDFTIQNHGSVFIFTARTERAKELVKNDMSLESWQTVGLDAFAVDHRVACDLASRFLEDGFTVV